MIIGKIEPYGFLWVAKAPSKSGHRFVIVSNEITLQFDPVATMALHADAFPHLEIDKTPLTHSPMIAFKDDTDDMALLHLMSKIIY